ncbi:MAG: sigma-70 family RNA polymerase sigma factor [Bythopirellula sp.]
MSTVEGGMLRNSTLSEQDEPKRPDKRPVSDRFVELLGKQERHLLPYVYSLTSDWNDAEEVAQRVRLKLWKQFAQYDETLSFGAWARAIAYYEVLTYRKEKQRRPDFLNEAVLSKLSETYEELIDPGDSRHIALQDCLEKLAAKDRKLVAEYYANLGKSADLSEAAGLSVPALRQKIYRIRKILFSCVERKVA